MPTAPPLIDCRPLPTFPATDLAAVRAAFRDATPIPLGQAWRGAAEPGFAPATVRTGWRGPVLLVFVELKDADIFTRAERHNQRFWELGDTFEMFLQPTPGPAYVEFHVTPNNLRLQLQFAAPPAPPGADDAFDTALIDASLFGSRTWVDANAGEWCVLAEIPAASVDGSWGDERDAEASGSAPAVLAKRTWRFSFSRYDYTRGRAQPVISSSSPHAEPRFHRLHEWGVLNFRG